MARLSNRKGSYGLSIRVIHMKDNVEIIKNLLGVKGKVWVQEENAIKT